MTETTVFLLGGLIAAALSLGLARLGYRQGGIAYALAWWCLFGNGIANRLSAEQAWIAPAVPILGSLFPALMVAGTLAMTGRGNLIRRYVWPATFAVVAVRVAVHQFAHRDLSQLVALCVFAASFSLVSLLLLRPEGRKPTGFERALALATPTMTGAGAYYTWLLLTGQPVVSALYVWLLVANSLCTLQIAAFIDRTTRRMADLESVASRERDARTQAEASYRRLTDQASDMITELGFDGRILYANPAHELVLGLRPESMLGQNVNILFPRNPRTDGGDQSSDYSNTIPHRRLVTARHANGEKRYLECDITRLRLDDDDERVVVTSRDVTARVLEESERRVGQQELEHLVEVRTEALDTSLERLRRSERLASMGTLAAGIAHQINNPIGSILLAAEYALAISEEGDEKAREHAAVESLQQIVEQAKRCGTIVSSMLRFARNEPTPKQPEDLAEILRRVCDQTRDYARGVGAELDTSRIAETLPVFGSAIELEQAFLNVIRNACESSYGSHRTVTVRIKGAIDRGAVSVVVQDDGKGMTRDEVAHALEPFYTTRLGRGGTGLGLSVAHGVVTDHGGYLTLESSPGEGTTVLISLPENREVDATS